LLLLSQFLGLFLAVFLIVGSAGCVATVEAGSLDCLLIVVIVGERERGVPDDGKGAFAVPCD
jgi:hypothetical protein